MWENPIFGQNWMLVIVIVIIGSASMFQNPIAAFGTCKPQQITEHKRLIFDFLISASLSHTHNTMFGRVFVLIRKPHLNYVFSDLFVCHSPCTRIRTCSDLHSSILRLCVDFPFYPIDGIIVVGRRFQVSFDSLDTKGIRFASHSNNHTHILIHETGVRAAPITFTEQTHTHTTLPTSIWLRLIKRKHLSFNVVLICSPHFAALAESIILPMSRREKMRWKISACL